MWCILNFPGEAIFQKTLLPLPCKECSKSFSESGSLKTHLRLIQEKSHLLVKNVPNHFLRRSHSPVSCSLFHKRKSVVSFNDLKSFNLFSSFLSLSYFLFKYAQNILNVYGTWGRYNIWMEPIYDNIHEKLKVFDGWHV